MAWWSASGKRDAQAPQTAFARPIGCRVAALSPLTSLPANINIHTTTHIPVDRRAGGATGRPYPQLQLQEFLAEPERCPTEATDPPPSALILLFPFSD
jgi:hypothetical protein